MHCWTAIYIFLMIWSISNCATRTRRALTDEEAVSVDEIIESLHETVRDNLVSPVLFGLIDVIDEAGGEVVYTSATGHRVRRRRSIGSQDKEGESPKYSGVFKSVTYFCHNFPHILRFKYST